MLLVPRLIASDSAVPPLGYRRTQKMRALRVRSVLVVLLRLGGADTDAGCETLLNKWDHAFARQRCGSLGRLCDTPDFAWHAVELPDQLALLLRRVVAGVLASERPSTAVGGGGVRSGGAPRLGKRERNVGQRLRLVSDLAKAGAITSASKGALKDAIITGDRDVERALAIYESTGDPNFLQHLVGGASGGGREGEGGSNSSVALPKRRLVRAVARGTLGGRIGPPPTWSAPAAPQPEQPEEAPRMVSWSNLPMVGQAETSMWSSLDFALETSDFTPGSVLGGRSISGSNIGSAPQLASPIDSAAEASLWGSLDIAVDLNEVHLCSSEERERGKHEQRGAGGAPSGRATSIEQARRLFIATNAQQQQQAQMAQVRQQRAALPAPQRESSVEQARRLFVSTNVQQQQQMQMQTHQQRQQLEQQQMQMQMQMQQQQQQLEQQQPQQQQMQQQRSSANVARARGNAQTKRAAAPVVPTASAYLQSLLRIRKQAQRDAASALTAAAEASATMRSRGGARFSTGSEGNS